MTITNTSRVFIAAILTLQSGMIFAQDVPAPPPPVDGPGDPPLLPGNLQAPQPPTQDRNPLQPPSPTTDAGLQLNAEPIAEHADVPQEELTADPELIIEAGGFLGSVADVAISPDARLIAATGDKVIRIIDAASGTLLRTLRGNRLRTSFGNTNGVAFSPDGQYLVVGVHDDGPHGSIRIYRTDNLDEIDSLLSGMSSACSHLRFSRDGRYMATVDRDGQIFLWDWSSKSILKIIPARDPGRPIIDALEFADSEPYLISVEHDGPHVYRVPDGTEISASEYMPPKMLGWMYDVLQKRVRWPYAMQRSPRTYAFRMDDGIWAAAGVGKQNGKSRPWVGVWNSRTMSPNATASTTKVVYTGHRWEVFATAISPNRDFVVSGDKFGEVHIWDANSGALRHKLTCQGQSIYEAAFTDSNDKIVFATKPDLQNWGFNSYGKSDRVLDLKQRAVRAVVPGSEKRIDEVTTYLSGKAALQAPRNGGQSYHVTFQGTGSQSSYRIPSGRIPSCYTVLQQPTLGTALPVLFADNLGFLGLWNASTDELRRAFRGHESMITSISPSKSGRIFVTGSTDRTIRIWSLLNYKPTGIFDFKYENSAVIEVKRGTTAAAAGVQVGDQIVSVAGLSLDRVYELMLYDRFDYKPGQTVPVVMKRGGRQYTYNMKLAAGFDYVEPLLNVFIGTDNQWVIWTPQGYYDCSPGADQLIGWHVNQGPDKAALFYRAQQFRKQLYRPDIIDKVIETGVIEEAEALAQNETPNAAEPLHLNERSSFDAHQPPQVTIQSPGTGDSFDDPRVTIDATAISTNELPISRVTLLHNGTPAKVFRPSNADEGKKLHVSHRLRLFPGRNEISFIAENNSATSNADHSRIVLNAPAAEVKSKVYVLAIGIDQYVNAGTDLENLKFASRDAKAFTDVVRKHSNGRLYSDVEIRLLTNSEASRGSILDGLQWLVDNVKQGDVVMFFCSGHGFLDDRDNFYLSSHEIDPQKLRSTGISWREVVGILHEELPACRRLVFLDACHSAGIRSAAQNPLQDLAAPELGTIFYASCTLQQKSFERDEWNHGAFTKAIVDILKDRKADVSPSTGDGLVSALELEIGITDRVATMTGDKQNPVVFSPEGLRKLNVLEFTD